MANLKYFELLNIFILVLVRFDFTKGDIISNSSRASASVRNSKIDSLINKWGDTAKLVRSNNTRRESKIAEIFMGVAYGANGLDAESKETVTESQSQQTKFHVKVVGKYNNIVGPSIIKFPIETSSMSTIVKTTQIITASTKDQKSLSTTESPKINPDAYIADINSKNAANDNSQTYNQLKNISRDQTIFNISYPWEKITKQLGTVWFVHIYLFAFLFCLISVISAICIICVWCLHVENFYWQGLILYMLIILMATSRSVLLFVDPYGVYGSLIKPVPTILYNLVINGTASLIAVFLCVLISDLYIRLFLPKWVLIGVSLMLTILLLLIDFLEYFQVFTDIIHTLRAANFALIACWGSILCLVFVALMIRIEKRYSGDAIAKNRLSLVRSSVMLDSSSIYLHKASRFGAIASLLQLLLSGLLVYTIAGPKELPGTSSLLTWAWWLQHTLARLLEFLFFVCITISTTYLSAQKQSFSRNPFIFSIFRTCCKAGSAGVHPSKSNSRQPLKIFTIQNPPNSVDYVTSDFQLVWTQGRNALENNYSNPDGNAKNLTHQGYSSSKIDFNRRPDPFGFSLTLPRNNYDNFREYSSEQLYDTIKDEFEESNKFFTIGKDIQVTNYKYLKNSKNVKTNSSIGHSVNSNLSDATALYWSPSHIAARGTPLHFNPYSRACNSMDQISEANTASQSEVRIDYLTDMSTSVDGISIGSEFIPIVGTIGIEQEGSNHPSHSLPFRTFTNISANENRNIKNNLPRSETNTPLLEVT